MNELTLKLSGLQGLHVNGNSTVTVVVVEPGAHDVDELRFDIVFTFSNDGENPELRKIDVTSEKDFSLPWSDLERQAIKRNDSAFFLVEFRQRIRAFARRTAEARDIAERTSKEPIRYVVDWKEEGNSAIAVFFGRIVACFTLSPDYGMEGYPYGIHVGLMKDQVPSEQPSRSRPLKTPRAKVFAKAFDLSALRDELNAHPAICGNFSSFLEVIANRIEPFIRVYEMVE